MRWTTGTDDDKRTHRGNVDYLDEKTYFVGGYNANAKDSNSFPNEFFY